MISTEPTSRARSSVWKQSLYLRSQLGGWSPENGQPASGKLREKGDPSLRPVSTKINASF